MFRAKERDEAAQSNFWISYADLMAGLLFVFILLIGAIVSKSMILREDLYAKEKKLGETQVALMDKMDTLKETKHKLLTSKERISKQHNQIVAQEHKIKLQAQEVRKLHILLANLQESLKTQKNRANKLSKKISSLQSDLNASNASLILTKDQLKLKERDLEKLNQLLLARNSKIDTLNKKIIILQNLTQDSNTTIQQKDKKLQEYEGKVIVLSNALTDKKNELKLKDKKLAKLLEALDQKKSKYDDLIARLKKQKARIKSLTGIRLKVIAALKETLGKKINIDRKSGALRLSSNILFDKGSSTLKEEAKSELKSAFEDYIGALVSNEAIRPYLDRIIIEGHTDSDGTYLYNLKLSQERALSVMNYLLTLPISKKYNLKKYLVASGRAYQDRIIHNGIEDKEASRRIEIKFKLKNQDAMQEIERILDEK